MTRDEVKELIMAVNGYYPRFTASTNIINSWYHKLQYIDFETAMKNLDEYVDQDEVGRVPTIARILKTEKLQAGVDYDLEYRKTLKLKRYDNETFIDQNGLLWAYPQKEVKQ